MKVLKFWAEWCGPCKLAAPIVKQACEEAGVPLQEVNVDDDPDNLAVKYKVKALPTVVILNKDGNESTRIVGKKSKDEYVTTIAIVDSVE